MVFNISVGCCCCYFLVGCGWLNKFDEEFVECDFVVVLLC